MGLAGVAHADTDTADNERGSKIARAISSGDKGEKLDFGCTEHPRESAATGSVRRPLQQRTG